jgi:outer membrane receptor protein involved in Fe transport
MNRTKRFRLERVSVGVRGLFAPVIAALALVGSPAAAQEQATDTSAAVPAQTQADPQAPAPLIFNITVVGNTPLEGSDLPVDQIAAPVQAATKREIVASGALDVADFMNRRLNAVHVNEIQGNPFQPDVSYRGYTASPLLGTPQGLSVYLDGVRINQPFGDIVSWDLIPRLAISSIALMPGSNPLFGLNTLGGALSLQTKNGVRDPGTVVQATYGSHVRRAIEFEHGGSRGGSGLNWYVSGNVFQENGWRDDSPSDVAQVFGKLGWQRPRTDASLSVGYASNVLNGNGLQETGFLDRDYASVYTKPDETNNRSVFLNLTGRHTPRNGLTLSGSMYFRHIGTETLNGDLNEDSLGQEVYLAGENAQNTPFPSRRCLSDIVEEDEPQETCNGLMNRTNTRQRSAGASGQITWLRASDRRGHQLTVGGAYDDSGAHFVQSSELGYLKSDRSITGTGAFTDARVDLDGQTRTTSLYATDTLRLHGRWHVTLSGRFNRTVVENVDAITPGGGTGSLDGTHTFSRLNPAAGLTIDLPRRVNAYIGYSEGSRAATSIELGCADPESPCKLPNAMAGDPPLDQVTTRTVEAGLRAVQTLPVGPVVSDRLRMRWHAGYFRADNHNDILFVMSEQTGFGYFRNFGSTRRQGLEAGADMQLGRVTVGAGYTFLDATFQSPETLNGESNSRNDAGPGLEGAIEIEPGSRMPLIPRHVFKTFGELTIRSNVFVDLGMVSTSSSYARGNENNAHQPDGAYYMGAGATPGYAVVNLGARYQLTPRVGILLQMNNLFDRQYATASQLGVNGFTESNTFIARPFPSSNGEFPLQHGTFVAPGAPAAFWIGAKLTL